jgi:UDP-glucose 4-epimerase
MSKKAKMRIAITGATGFIGKYAVDYFLSMNHRVRAIGRDKIVQEAVFGNKAEIYESDYSLESLKKGLEGVDAVVHLAAQLMQRDTNPLKLSQFYATNLQSTENLLLASQEKGISRVCQTSSISVYSKMNKLPFREIDMPYPDNIYGVSKMACEHLGNLFSLKSEVKVTTLRLARLFGFGEREGLVFSNYIDLASRKKTLNIWGKGITGIDYIYVKDVVSAISKALFENAPFGIYNIGSGNCYPVVQIAESINKVFGNEGNISFDSEKVEGGFEIYMDCTKAKEILGWEPKWELINALNDIKDIISNH